MRRSILYKCVEFHSNTTVIIVTLLSVSTLWCIFLQTTRESITLKGSDRLVESAREQKKILDEERIPANENNNDELSLSDGEHSDTKVLCFILTSPTRVDASLVIKETWGSRCDKLVFYGGFQNKELPVYTLNVKENYRFLWGKTKAALKHLAEHFSSEFQWFLKADDDTFIVMENLKRLLNHYRREKQPLWMGYKLKHRSLKTGYMSGGAGYVFNTMALKAVAKILSNEITTSSKSCKLHTNQGMEDLELGRCFHSIGIKDVSTLDDEGKQTFLPLPLDSFLNNKISMFHWIWRQSWYPVITGQKCCSQDLISMHQVDSNDLKRYYYVLYGNQSSQS